jgi:hypothetical protein
MNIVIGIISYFPDKNPDRELRINRFNSLLSTLERLWPSLPIVVVAQNWGDYQPPKNVTVHSFNKLGILNARKTLREIFLKSDFSGMVTMDDDVIISGDSGEEYLRQISIKPNGMGVFCWEHSQLNLLYISREIYSKVGLPEVDPEKDEGFEDVVFTSNCKQLFPEDVFTFNDTGLSEISFRYAGPDKVPSTWAGGYRNWSKLRGNTKKIKENLEGNMPLGSILKSIIKKDTIDIVVPYVDSSDPQWQELYNTYNKKETREDSNGKQRFRGNELFKYWFRSVEQYTPWINNVFLIVQSISQVPDWILKTDKIKIITHDMFIPNEFLPVFNSQAIEMFIHRIPGLSERFLYSNDDMYFIGPLKPEDFFQGEGVRTEFKIVSIGTEMPLWKASIINSGMLVNKEETEQLKIRGNYLTPMHITRPYLKSKLEEVHSLYGEDILKTISKFREPYNYTVYIYDLHLRKNGLTFPKQYLYQHFSNRTSINTIGNFMANPLINKSMCLNDVLEVEDKAWNTHIKEKFNHKFPKKSKYEK